jgi:molecular chaperone GrpE
MSKHKNTIDLKDGHENKEDRKVKSEDHDGKETSSAELNALESEIQNLKDLLQRKVAEFENYKRRTDSELINMPKYAAEKVIKELLPVYDDLQRSIDSVSKGETKDFETLSKGMSLIYDKFKSVLEKEGLTEIHTVGKPFDVELSTALMQVPRDDVKPHTVIESFEKGYKLNGKVIRHEKVMVSSEPELAANDKNEEE